MAVKSDNFNDNVIDTATFDATASAGGTVTEVNNRMEIAGTTNDSISVLCTDITYDFSEPGSAEVNIAAATTRSENWISVGLENGPFTGTAIDPWNVASADVYRWGYAAGDNVAQVKVAGVGTTIFAGAGGGLGSVFKIEFPTTGNDVRFISNAVERSSRATYDLSSRLLYVSLFGYQAGAALSVFDDWSITYTAAGGSWLNRGYWWSQPYGNLAR